MASWSDILRNPIRRKPKQSARATPPLAPFARGRSFKFGQHCCLTAGAGSARPDRVPSTPPGDYGDGAHCGRRFHWVAEAPPPCERPPTSGAGRRARRYVIAREARPPTRAAFNGRSTARSRRNIINQQCWAAGQANLERSAAGPIRSDLTALDPTRIYLRVVPNVPVQAPLVIAVSAPKYEVLQLGRPRTGREIGLAYLASSVAAHVKVRRLEGKLPSVLTRE